MRVLQLIDSLRPGGAERMAVLYANALARKIEQSYLCCTRIEGLLKNEIDNKVSYHFLDKKNSFDLIALKRLAAFVKKESIDIVHAHGTSYFMASLLKISGLKFQLVWHDHYGGSDYVNQRSIQPLKFCSRFFNGIISVNKDLLDWAKSKLYCAKVLEVKNFITLSNGSEPVSLSGEKNDFKIVNVANLREQKSHDILIKAFEVFAVTNNASLHLIGANPKTAWSQHILKLIEKSEHREKIFYYGERHDVRSMLKDANLGVIASKSEGLPLALLEYGASKLPVVCTNVGACAKVINGNGWLVPAKKPDALAIAFEEVINNAELSRIKAEAFYEDVVAQYSEDSIISVILNFYKNL